MLEKTMKAVLRKKIDAWTESISDKEVRAAIRRDLIVTGGCFTSMIQNETPRDFDCYFRTKDTVLKVARYYVDQWNEAHPCQANALGKVTKVFLLDGANPDKEILDYYQVNDPHNSCARMLANITADRVKIVFPSDGITGDPEKANASEELGTPANTVEILDEVSAEAAEQEAKKERGPYCPVFLSSNAITLSDGIQIIVRFYGEPDQIHDTYDFAHTKAYWDEGQRKLSIPARVYECVANKTLVYTGSKYPVCSMFRTRKFIERGWKINAGQILKMAMQISQLDLLNVDVLEDQLVGVDSLYFMALIHQFRERMQKDPNFELTSGYVISVVDKIF
jgi:hypothetical protein